MHRWSRCVDILRYPAGKEVLKAAPGQGLGHDIEIRMGRMWNPVTLNRFGYGSGVFQNVSLDAGCQQLPYSVISGEGNVWTIVPETTIALMGGEMASHIRLPFEYQALLVADMIDATQPGKSSLQES
jgi:hypothetical protein